MDELQRVAERMMRAELAKLPDGVHTFTDYIDGVGEEPVPIPICVRVEIAGDEVLISFEGTSPQVDASVNCPVGMVRAACYCAIRGIVGGEIPNCEGYMTPIRIDAPAGTVVNPVLPAACGARGVIGYRVYDALMGALAPIVPDRVLAAGEGGPTLIAFGGYDEERRPFGTTEVLVGTWGARATRDGLEGVSNPLANLGNQPVELLEADIPLEVERYGLVPDSGGAGRQRGGLAYVRAFRVRTPTGDAHDPHRSARPSSLRPRGRRARGAVEQRRRSRATEAASCRRCRWRPRTSSRATASRTSRPAAEASGRRSSATRRPCSRTCSTRRCRSAPPGRSTAS